MENVNLYDPQPISPVVKIKENMSIFSAALWQHYQVDYIEPMPRSSTLTFDLVTLSGAINIGANGLIQKQLITFLQINDREVLHLRFEPLDDVEGILWEQSMNGRFATQYMQARASRFTAVRDPWLATTTFFILGKDRNMNLEVRNPDPIAKPQARFAFWGLRYIVTPLLAEPKVSTYIPAEGRPA